MRIGINEVLVYDRSTGTRQRELNTLPSLLTRLETVDSQAFVYVASPISAELLHRLTGSASSSTIVRTPLPAVPTYERVLKGIPYWRKRVLQDQLDLFHTSYYPIPRVPIPTVLTVNDLRFVHLPETYRLWRRFFLRLAVAPSLKRATRIIAISENTKSVIINHFGISAEKIDVVHIPASSQFRPVTEEKFLSQVRRKYSLPERFLLYVGHLEPRKNLARLIQAYFRLRTSREIKHKFVVLGQSSHGFKALMEKVTKSSFTGDVIFTGYVVEEDLPAIYSLADLLAFPSLYEGFGLPLTEAMACGTPVVTSNVSALPEVAGDAAILVNPYSVQAIADGIVKVLDDEELRLELVERGLQRVKAFSATKAADAIYQTYRKTLGE